MQAMDQCKHCGSNQLHTQAKPPDVGLYCDICGQFQKWVKQESNTDTGETASDTQQKYALSLLTRWKHKNVPMTSKQAGAIIQAFKE